MNEIVRMIQTNVKFKLSLQPFWHRNKDFIKKIRSRYMNNVNLFYNRYREM